MLPRTLVFTVLCAAALWPLRALACFNSMDTRSIFSSHAVWTDLLVWAAGAVFLNRVVLVNVLAPAAEGQPKPSTSRRAFFLLVGACLVLVLVVVLGGGPLVRLLERDMYPCLLNRPLVLVLLLSPAVVFVLQSLLFRRPSQWLFGGNKHVALVGLVVTSVALAVGVDMARESIVLPALCGPSSHAVIDTSAY